MIISIACFFECRLACSCSQCEHHGYALRENYRSDGQRTDPDGDCEWVDSQRGDLQQTVPRRRGERDWDIKLLRRLRQVLHLLVSTREQVAAAGHGRDGRPRIHRAELECALHVQRGLDPSARLVDDHAVGGAVARGQSAEGPRGEPLHRALVLQRQRCSPGWVEEGSILAEQSSELHVGGLFWMIGVSASGLGYHGVKSVLRGSDGPSPLTNLLNVRVVAPRGVGPCWACAAGREVQCYGPMHAREQVPHQMLHACYRPPSQKVPRSCRAHAVELFKVQPPRSV